MIYAINQTKKMKTLLAVVLAVILSAIIVGGGTYYFMNSRSEDDKAALESQVSNLTTQLAQKNMGSSEENESTQKYTNETYDLSFEYPNDWYVFENDTNFEAMCQAQSKIESSRNTYQGSTPCVSDTIILTVTDINGYCTLGGCVDRDLKAMSGSPRSNGFVLKKITAAEKSEIESNNDGKEGVTSSEVGSAKLYKVPADLGGVSGPALSIALFDSAGSSFTMQASNSTGALVLDDLLETLTVAE